MARIGVIVMQLPERTLVWGELMDEPPSPSMGSRFLQCAVALTTQATRCPAAIRSGRRDALSLGHEVHI